MFEVPRAAAATVMVFGAMGLVGSLLDIGVLERIGAGWATMDASAGLALLLTGGALWGLADEKAPAAARRTSQVLALLVGVIGVLSLMVYAYRWPSLAAYLDPGYLAGGRGSGGGHRAEPRPRLAGAAPGEHGDARAPPAPLRVPGRGDGRHHRARHHGHPVWAPSLVNSLVLFVYVGLVVGTAIVLHREDIARQKTEQRLMAQEAAARALTKVETLDAATQRVLSAIAEHLGWDVGLYWRVDRERNVLHLAHLWHSGQLNVAPFEAQVRNLSFRPGMGLPGRVWMTGQPVWNPDMQRFPSFRAWGALESGLHASFGFPVRVGAEVVGVLEFISRSPREPDRALLDTLPVLGSQLGESMERKAAEERLRDSEERLRLLLQGVKDHAIFMLDADGRVSSWNDEAERIAGYTRADILGEGLAVLYTPEDREAGLPEQALRRGGYEPVFARMDSGPAMRAALEQEQWDIIISDHKMPGFSGLEALALVRQRGLDIPFIIVSGTIGEETAVLAMKSGAHDYVMKDRLARLAPAVDRELKEAEERRARRVAEAERAASLVREREARAAAERAERQSAFLAEASRVLAQSLDLDDTVTRVLRLPLPDLADWALLELTRDGGRRRVALAHPERTNEEAAAELLERLAADSTLPFGSPLERPRVLGAVLAAYPGLERLVEEFGVGSVLAVPLSAHGGNLGTLALVTTRESGRTLTAQDVPLVEALADRCALSLENARLFHQAEEAIRARDTFLSIASHELRTPLTPLQLALHRLEPMQHSGLGVTEQGPSPVPVQAMRVNDATRTSARMGLPMRRLAGPTSLGAFGF